MMDGCYCAYVVRILLYVMRLWCSVIFWQDYCNNGGRRRTGGEAGVNGDPVAHFLPQGQLAG